MEIEAAPGISLYQSNEGSERKRERVRKKERERVRKIERERERKRERNILIVRKT